ncbi:glycosyltransferase [Photobacterium damselae]|uniref:glycosyltransferase n=1 Tax=Photobacterium damselae TaxID=38293 RepID=UPI003D7D2959
MKKDIILFINSLGGGGAEGVCVSIANGLKKLGWNVTLLVMNLDNVDNLQKVSDDIIVKNLNVSNARKLFFKLRRFLNVNKESKLICFTYELSILTILARKSIYNNNIKIISRNINSLSKLSQNDKSTWRRKVVYPLIKRFYGHSDLIINQCNGMKNELLLSNANLKDKSIVIYNPVNYEIEEESKKIDYKKIIKRNYLLYVGRLENQKDIHSLIYSFSIILNYEPGLQLRIIGKGSLERELKGLSKQLGLDKNIEFLGFKSDVSKYYLEAKAVLLTSYFEGFPNVLIESVTLGTPVISFDCNNGPSEIINKENGKLVSGRDVSVFAESVIDVISGEYSYYNIHKNAEKYYLDSIIYQWDSILDRMD